MTSSPIVPDLLRALITDVMLVALLYTMSQPKYNKKWVYILASTAVVMINLGVNCYFYLQSDYNSNVKVDLIMLLAIAIALKPLFSDTKMQWCFSFVTVLNIYAAIVFLSYILCELFPNPMYGNAILRLLLFSIVLLIFWRILGPLYHKVAEYWHVFSILTVALLINYLYYFLYEDIVLSMTENYYPIVLLIILTIALYIGIFLALKVITDRYGLREENLRIQRDKELLRFATSAMEQRLSIMDSTSRKMSIVDHDRRHFNQVLLELLRVGDVAEAKAILEKQVSVPSTAVLKYCENSTVNAVVAYCTGHCEQAGVAFETRLDIPANPGVDSLELAMVVSNLLENAVHACKKLQKEKNRFIRFKAVFTGRLLLELENPYDGEVCFDKKGYPISKEAGHGIGSGSILAFAEKQKAQVIYTARDGIFQVRMIL